MTEVLGTPSGLQLREAWREDADDFEMVQETTGPDDHGYSWERTFRRRADGTFWQVNGVNQSQGAYDTLRDDYNYITVTQVWPHAVTVTEYRCVPPKEPT